MTSISTAFFRTFSRAGLASVAVTCLCAATAWAAGESELSEAGFVPASDIQQEAVNGGLLMIIAYAIAWLLLLGYAYSIARKARQVNEELDAVRLLARDLDARLEEEELRS